MRHTLKLFSCLAAVAAASSNGAIFLFDARQQSPDHGQDAIHEDAARLLLQQRMLSTQTTPSTALEEPVIELLDKFGGNQNNLFQDAKSRNQQKLLIMVEGLIKDTSALSENPTTTLNIPKISPDFVDSFIGESVAETDEFYSSGWKHCEYEATGDSEIQVSSSKQLQSCLYQHPIFIGSPKTPVTRLFEGLPLSSLQAWSDATGTKEILRISFKEQTKDTSKATQLLASLSEMFDYQERTLVLVPHAQFNKEHMKHRPGKVISHVQSKRNQAVDLPSTLAPVCHNTNNSCTSATNGCSGHGWCYLKSGGKNECYACKCHKTTVRTADGSVRTVQWGGSACQKEDISTQFFLLGTITVLAILAVGGGIGLLFSVGQEELPSVISAGISSVRTTR